MMPRAEGSILGRKTSGPANSGCAPQKVDPALIAPFRPAMLGRFVPVDSTTPPVSYESGEGPWAVLYPVLCQNSAF